MRVLHVYSGNLFGGIEAILIALARGRSLCPGVEHEFAVCFQGKLARELTRVGVRPHHLGPVRISRPATVRSARAALAALLQSTRPTQSTPATQPTRATPSTRATQLTRATPSTPSTGSAAFDRVICHAPWAQGIFGGVARRAGVPQVFWAHDVMKGRHWTERLARRVTPDLAICNSRFTAGTLGTLYANVPSAVVYAPVEMPRSPADAEERRLTRLFLDTPERAIAIILASRSERWKGHTVLLEALSELRDVPGWVWWQVGGAQRPAEAAFLGSLKQMANRFGISDRVRWIGERDDVPRLLAAADLYCQPNLEPEPFGVAFVEALAAGLPVVTVARGGACEIVDDSCGVLVPPRDPRALAAELKQLIEDDGRRARLASAAPARAIRLCDPATALRRIADLLAVMTPAALRA
jgi:glycosyltransferase involved in cell wall biosynthesis